MKGLLLAGNHGTRPQPLTFTGNKHMLPFGLERLREADVRDVGIILGPIKEGVMQLPGDGSRYGVNI